MKVKVSMSYLDDEKYSVKNISGNELVVDMYEKGRKKTYPLWSFFSQLSLLVQQ